MEEFIIEFIKENEFIYNKKDRNYKNVFLRDKKFNELSKKLNIPMEKLKSKWKNLRDKFQKEHIKLNKSASGDSASSPKKKWKWYDSLLFLIDVDSSNNRTTGNYIKNKIDKYSELTLGIDSSNASNSVFEVEWSNSSYEVGLDHDLSMPLPKLTPQPFVLNVESQLSSDTSTPSPMPSTPKNRKTKSDAIVDSAKNEMQELIQIAKQSFARPEEIAKTPVTLFFDTMAAQVNEAKLSPEDFGRMQMGILQIVNEILYNKK